MSIKMSEYEIPFHIQEEIMKRLPVKSLVQFRSVSKSWKSLINSSEFIAAHCLRRHTQPQHLLVYHEDLTHCIKYVSYTDDDTFPQKRSLPTLPLPVKELKFPSVVGSSCGLLCLYGYVPNITYMVAVLWNPLIRKSVVVPFPEKGILIDDAMPRACLVGFGVCPVTNDPKIVVITKCDVVVYTLSSGKWRSLSTNLPTKPLVDYFSRAVTTDVYIYWRASFTNHYAILSFDVTNEIFEVIDLLDCLVCLDSTWWHISKLRESLAIVQSGINGISTVWMMEDGVHRSFIKLFTIPRPHNHIVGFRKNAIPVTQVTDGSGYDYDDDDERIHKLVVYEPNSEHNVVLESIKNSEIYRRFNMNSYMETLLLLGRPNCNSY